MAKFLSLLLVLVMVFSMLPTLALADTGVNVYFSFYDGQNYDFPVTRQKITVNVGTAAKYGLENAGEGTTVGTADHSVKDGEVSALDALLAAHETIYGESFSPDTMSTYFGGSSSFVTKIFERSGNISFAVNDRLPVGELSDGYAINEYVLNDGDDLEFFIYSDASMWSDYLTWFDQKEVTLITGQPLTLTLNGYMAMESMYGTPGQPTPVPSSLDPVEGAEITLLVTDPATNTTVFGDCLGGNENPVVTDANGQFTYTFTESGTYFLGADAEIMGSFPIVSPYCKVTVVNPPTSQWKNFRNSDVNMGITSAMTPKDSESAVLRWNAKLGSGWGASPSVQIIVDDCLVIMGGNTIYKLDLDTGETVASGTMSGSPSFGYTPSTYAEEEGLIIAPLGNGTLQAFNGYTLESEWIYNDALKGQALSPVTYSDGYIYTGFWNSETADANFVCVNAANGELQWSYTVAGGFYWAGSVAVGDYILVGTDDGASGSSGDSMLLSFKKTYSDGETVEPVSSVSLIGCGDQRSSLAFSDGKVYFTTKGGYLGSASVSGDTGTISGLNTVSFGAQSTSTPIVYGNYVYFGAGSGISSSGSGGNFVVADKNTLNVVDYVGLRGYPQCSMLLSTAYIGDDGCLYFYSTYNNYPGGISLIKAGADDAAGVQLVELYDAAGFEQYCVASVICDTGGNLYYKNDGGNILSIGTNAAYLTSLSADVGTGLSAFKPSTSSYELVVPAGTESIAFSATACDGGAITVNGSDSMTVALAGGVGAAVIEVTKGADTRSYTVNIREACADAALSELKVNESNSYSGTANTLSPAFDKDTLGYVCAGVSADRQFVNVWPAASDANATVKVYAVSNVDANKTNPDGTISVTAQSSGHDRYAVYFGDDTKPMSIRIEVTAEDGAHTRSYNLVMTKAESYDSSAEIYVTISDKGSVSIPQKPVSVTDIDLDGKVTVHDALYAAHEAFYPGGAAAGYAANETQFGLALTRLWGDESGNFGYFINNTMAMSMTDEVKTGQYLAAYITANVYPDNDAYSYFDSNNYSAKVNTVKSATLSAVTGYDDITWEPIFSTYSAASLTAYDSVFNVLDVSDYTVNNAGDGEYELTFKNEGTYYVVATAENNAIVPAVCVFNVEKSDSGGSGGISPSNITVSFRLIGSEKANQDVDLSASDYLPKYVTWMATDDYVVEDGSTVGDLFKHALDQAGLKYTGFSAGYIDSITAPEALGSYKLAEFTNGPRSGWMYTVNGAHPGRGLDAWTLNEDDVVVWHYVNDYSHEVEDWFDEESYPSLGDGTYWSGWLDAEDVNPLSDPDSDIILPIEELSFSDVKIDSWYYDAVSYAVKNKLMEGTGGGKFDPEGKMTRAMLVTVLYRLDGEPEVSGKNGFTDVKNGQWYSNAIIWANQTGIAGGYGGGLFGTEDDITREQIASILQRYAQYKKYGDGNRSDLEKYTDSENISDWALDAMKWANGEGLITGRTSVTLVPGGDASRAEVASILMRFIENIVKKIA